jgi:succinate dehydrogenase cytochrome b556 subunit
MQTTRPVFLDLWRIKLPVTGVVSILHRISGILMVLAIPVAAILFHHALSGPDGFAMVAGILDFWLVKLILLVLAWSLLHHLFGGFASFSSIWASGWIDLPPDVAPRLPWSAPLSCSQSVEGWHYESASFGPDGLGHSTRDIGLSRRSS